MGNHTDDLPSSDELEGHGTRVGKQSCRLRGSESAATIMVI